MSRNYNASGSSEPVGEHVRIFLRGSTWQANYQHHGRQCRESLKTSNKKVALRRALQLDQQLQTGDRPVAQTPCDLDEALQAYEEFLVAERRRPKTLTKYRYVFQLIKALAQKLGRGLVSQIDLSFADKFRAQRARDCSAKTVYTDLVILRQFVKFAVMRKLIRDDPLQGLKLKKPKPTPQPCFDDEQIALILQRAPSAHFATFQLLAETGLRIGEAKWLTWDDVDFVKNVIHVRPKAGWEPKSGDARVVPMTPKVQTLLRDHRRVGRWVLTAATTKAYPALGRQMSERRALNALKRVLKKLGIKGKLHTFRHYFVSRCLTSGIEESVVRSWVGHIDEDILRLYTHINSRTSQDRILRLGETGRTTA